MQLLMLNMANEGSDVVCGEARSFNEAEIVLRDEWSRGEQREDGGEPKTASSLIVRNQTMCDACQVLMLLLTSLFRGFFSRRIVIPLLHF